MKSQTTITVRKGEQTSEETFDSSNTDEIFDRLKQIKKEYDREFDSSMSIVFQDRPYLQIDISHD